MGRECARARRERWGREHALPYRPAPKALQSALAHQTRLPDSHPSLCLVCRPKGLFFCLLRRFLHAGKSEAWCEIFFFFFSIKTWQCGSSKQALWKKGVSGFALTQKKKSIWLRGWNHRLWWLDGNPIPQAVIQVHYHYSIIFFVVGEKDNPSVFQMEPFTSFPIARACELEAASWCGLCGLGTFMMLFSARSFQKLLLMAHQ